MDEYGRAVVILVGVATAILGWMHANRSSLARIQAQVEESRGLLIETMEHRLAEQERLWRLQLEDVERRLRACEERWRAPIGSASQRWPDGSP